MGVDGFLRTLSEAVDNTHLRHFAGQTLVVDALSWLHKAYVGRPLLYVYESKLMAPVLQLLRLRVRAVHGQGDGQVRAVHAAQGGHDERLRRGEGRPRVRRPAAAAQGSSWAFIPVSESGRRLTSCAAVVDAGEATELQGGKPQASAAGHGRSQEDAGERPTGRSQQGLPAISEGGRAAIARQSLAWMDTNVRSMGCCSRCRSLRRSFPLS